MAIPTKWQDCDCIRCGVRLSDNKNSITMPDVLTGGIKGMHKVCPAPVPQPTETP